MPEPARPSEIFPERLKAARDLRKMNQAQLAAKAALPPSSIAHFESGARKPSFENLGRLANALEVTTDYLLGRVSHHDVAREADPIYRDASKLSQRDRDLAREFLKMLANQARDKK